ncbi:MAG: DUF6247 family protein [Pseudonocardia sp.]|nr:DUF6247 family protein [Pseudonocardia sp.]
MTAARPDPSSHPLAGGASPVVIRRWLRRPDAERFVAEYRSAMDVARVALELGAVLDVIERWRRIAVLQTDPAAYRRTMRRAAGLATGESSPEDEPLEVTSAKAGL